MLHEFANNVMHNLFKPLLLFFYMGFSIPLLGVPFEFPHVIYQGLTMYLLIAIGWHGGEELASLDAAGVQQAVGFMLIGFLLNFVIGCIAYIGAARGDAAAQDRRCHGRRLLRLGFGRHVRHLPRRARVGQSGHRLCRLYAGHVGRDGNSRLPGGAVPGLAFAPQWNGPAGATCPTSPATTRTRSASAMARRSRPVTGTADTRMAARHGATRPCATANHETIQRQRLPQADQLGVAARGVSQPGLVSVVRRNCHRLHQPVAGRKGGQGRRLPVRDPVSGRTVPVPARDGDDGLQAAAGLADRGYRRSSRSR